MNKINFKEAKVKNKIYQFRIDIKGAKPPIWRRIQVEKNITFHQLHLVIQNIFNWLDYHLHEFEINEKVKLVDMNHESYEDMSDMPSFLGIPQPKEYNEHDIKLNKYIKKVGDTIVYTYDFGDNWEHTIKLEKILDLDSKKTYPNIVTGRKVAPFEDCGGIWGWEELCKIMEGKAVDIDEEYKKELLEHHPKFDPNEFGKEDIEDINENFKEYKYGLFFED
jgi:hypothetical protein